MTTDDASDAELTVAQVVRRRLAAQHLTGPGAASVGQVVRDSLAVQAQDPPLSRWSVGTRARVTDRDVQAAMATGEIVRLHILRPTWHYVHRDDLRWLLALTSERVLRGMGARHRQLAITDEVCAQAEATLLRELAAGPRTRTELQPTLPHTDTTLSRGEVVGHLLLIAELRGLVCSGPLVEGQHTYRLVDDVVPLSPALDDDEALDRLVRRYIAGRGPSALNDVQRFTKITVREARAVLGHDDFAHAVVDDTDLWWLPDALGQRPGEAADDGGVLLLPTFDETFLSHKKPRFPRVAGHRLGEAHFDPREAGGGIVVIDGVDVGGFKRVKSGASSRVTHQLAGTVAQPDAERLETVSAQLVEFFDCEA